MLDIDNLKERKENGDDITMWILKTKLQKQEQDTLISSGKQLSKSRRYMTHFPCTTNTKAILQNQLNFSASISTGYKFK